MNRPDRPAIRQNFYPFAVNVLTTATPLAQAGINSALTALYTGILISVPAGGVVVWLGDSSVSAAKSNGLAISPSVPVFLGIKDVRQMYEVQAPLTDKFCFEPIAIPISVWDVSTIYLAATGAPQVCGVILFSEGFK